MRREEKEKFSALFSFLPDSSLLLCLHLLQAFFFQKISATLHFSCFQDEFSWVLHLFLMLSLDDCWWELFLSLEMLYYHEFMFNCWGISRVEAIFWFIWKNWIVQKTGHTEYAGILNFLDVIQMWLHFYDIFSG